MYLKTIPFNSECNIHYFEEDNKNQYYLVEYNGVLNLLPISIYFPIEWIIMEKETHVDCQYWVTGPFYCNYCKNIGVYNGVFIGYCNICAEKHNYERGLGLTNAKTISGKPYEVDLIQTIHGILPLPRNKSIWNTYLKDIDLNQLGSQELHSLIQNHVYIRGHLEVTYLEEPMNLFLQNWEEKRNNGYLPEFIKKEKDKKKREKIEKEESRQEYERINWEEYEDEDEEFEDEEQECNEDYNLEKDAENKRINEALFDFFKKEDEEKAYWKQIYEEHQRKEWEEYEEE